MKISSFYLLFIVAIIIFTSCDSSKPDDSSKTQELVDSIQLVNKTYDFGIMKKTDTLRCAFELINFSDNLLLIKDVKPSCGCTTVEYSKNPLKKGEKGSIQVVYIPNVLGYTKKSVVVETNFNPPFHVFYLEGNVEEND